MINIAIDGYMGSGKSVLAKTLSQRLGLRYLDTGAIFRGIAVAFCQKCEANAEITLPELKQFISTLNIDIKFIDDVQHVFINKKDVTSLLRTEEISKMSSVLSTYDCVRQKYLEIAQNFAENNNCVMEGRDICTVVMPNADAKFFLTATEEVRAKRRLLQLEENGKKANYDDVLADLKERDYRDSHRQNSPLKIAKDATVIDSTSMTLEEVANSVINTINKRLGME